ncbi:MAG: alpha/beta hydrolase [Campylobacterales bacterium]|nr:alpha/beta hydrolase [Campylobacterales bacterium]
MMYTLFSLFTFFILAFVLYEWQYYIVFSPIYYREEVLDESFLMLSMTTDDGVLLEGVVYEPENFSATLLFFGGRSHDSVGLIKRLSKIFPHARIITFNYRSYGKNSGSLNEKNILNDGLKIAQLVKKNYGDFYILGFSIGASVASFVASKTDVLGVFLVGAFDSIAQVAKEKYSLDLSWCLRYKFDNREFVQNIDAKTYLFVSKSDEIVSIQNARNLKSHVKNLALYKELDNLSHKELLWDAEIVSEINKAIK